MIHHQQGQQQQQQEQQRERYFIYANKRGLLVSLPLSLSTCMSCEFLFYFGEKLRGTREKRLPRFLSTENTASLAARSCHLRWISLPKVPTQNNNLSLAVSKPGRVYQIGRQLAQVGAFPKRSTN